MSNQRDKVGLALHGESWANGHDYDAHEEVLERLANLLPLDDDIIIRKDGDMFMAVRGDFVNLQESEAYWADTPMIALSNFLAHPKHDQASQLGYWLLVEGV